MKKFLIGFCIWVLLNLTFMIILKDKGGAAFNLITIPVAVLITAAIIRFRQEKETEEELHQFRRQQAFEHFEKERKEAENSCKTSEEEIAENATVPKNEEVLENADDPIHNLFMKGYTANISLWERRTRCIDSFSSMYNDDYRVTHEKEFERAEKEHDKIVEDNANEIQAKRINLEGRIPKDLLLYYNKLLGSIKESSYQTVGVVKSTKQEDGNIIQMHMDFAVYISHSSFGFNNIWIDRLFMTWIYGKNKMFFFYPEYIIESDENFSRDFNIIPMDTVIVKYSEQEFTERIDAVSDGYEVGRYLYIDDKGKAPNVIDKGKKCHKKVYGKMVLIPFGQELYFKNPAEGREMAETLRKYISKYRETIGTSIKNPLDDLIGLKRVKEEITTLTNYIKMKQKRDEMDMKSPNISYHCVFTGNPGTGKTTVARIIAGIYRDMGVLCSGHLVETDRSGLVAEYVGQTAVKTNAIIDSALDGVLFIDEVYTLAQGDKTDFGHEAIATLLKRMEDARDRLVVILAGYTNEIEEFINSNPGLRSRFNRYIHFEDYSAEELYEIFCLQMKKNEYTMTDDASQFLKEKLAAVVANKPKDFGNARYVRNLFEKAVEQQANRLAARQELAKEDLTLITKEDLFCTHEGSDTL